MTDQMNTLPAETRENAVDIRSSDTVQFATFYFGQHLFGLPIEEIIEINRTLEVTPVPLAPDYVAGVVNLRGQILTAINLGKRIGLSGRTDGGDGYNNVITGNREEPISLLVEGIGDVMSVPRGEIEPPPDLIAGVDVSYVKNVFKLPGRLLIILDGHALEAPPGA